jgi:hypothetical protein
MINLFSNWPQGSHNGDLDVTLCSPADLRRRFGGTKCPHFREEKSEMESIHSSCRSTKVKSTILWDITMCSPLKVNQRSGGTYRLYLQGLSITRARNRVKADGKQSHQSERALLATCLHASFLLGSFFDPEDGGNVPPKRWLTFNGVHDIIYQTLLLFITTAVRTSYPTSTRV